MAASGQLHGRHWAGSHGRRHHRSATNKRRAGLRLGYDCHIPCSVRSSKWNGRINSANLGEPVLLLPLHMSLASASLGVAQAGLEAVAWAKKLGCNIQEVIVDWGYTNPPPQNPRHPRGLRKTQGESIDRRLPRFGRYIYMPLVLWVRVVAVLWLRLCRVVYVRGAECRGLGRLPGVRPGTDGGRSCDPSRPLQPSRLRGCGCRRLRSRRCRPGSPRPPARCTAPRRSVR